MYYLGIQNPNDLSDEDWAMRVNEIQYLREQEAKNKGLT